MTKKFVKFEKPHDRSDMPLKRNGVIYCTNCRREIPQKEKYFVQLMQKEFFEYFPRINKQTVTVLDTKTLYVWCATCSKKWFENKKTVGEKR